MGKKVTVSGKLEPIHFTITPGDDIQVAEVYMLKAGHFYRREFDKDATVKDMLNTMKLDLFTIQFSLTNFG